MKCGTKPPTRRTHASVLGQVHAVGHGQRSSAQAAGPSADSVDRVVASSSMPEAELIDRLRRRRWPWAIAVVVVGVTVFSLVWFQPQKLFIDERVSDRVPVAVSTALPPTAVTALTATTAAPSHSVPVDVVRGTFISRDHATSGTVRVLELADGTRSSGWRVFAPPTARMCTCTCRPSPRTATRARSTTTM